MTMTNNVTALGISKAYFETKIWLRDAIKTEKFFFLFWLAGPFIYLIERSPADAWLSLIALSFLVKCAVRKQWEWTEQLWFRSTLLFWVICIISAILSSLPQRALAEAVIWIRFPLFAAACQIWLGKYRFQRVMMLLALAVAMFLMTGILTAEVILEPKDRLSWPYGDLVPGNYLAKATMPALVVLAPLFLYQKNLLGLLGLFYTLLISALTGERINLLLRICSSGLALMSWRANLRRLFYTFSVACLFLGLLFSFNENLKERFGTHFIQQSPLSLETSPYWAVWRAGLQGAHENPILGVGPGNLRFVCDQLPEISAPGVTDCDNHPHHYYFQLLGEVGIIGLIAGILMFSCFLWACWQARKTNGTDSVSCPLAATAYIMPLAFFWPLQSTADFFGQWNNCFMWLALGFAIMQNQNYKQSKES